MNRAKDCLNCCKRRDVNKQMAFSEKRKIGNAIHSFSRLGFGAAPIGNLYRETSDAAAQAAVFSALDGGINYFDTAPYYGFGLSEKRLGAALKAHPKGKDALVSSKVGRCLRLLDEKTHNPVRHGFASTEQQEPYFDYSYEGVMKSFESSCNRLGREKINILFAHDLGELTHGNKAPEMLWAFCNGGYQAMVDLKNKGLIDAIGIGVNECAVCLDIISKVNLDCILLAGRYTLLDQIAEAAVFPLCAGKNIAIILGGPFNSGILATGVNQSSGPHYYNYEPAPHAIIDRVRKLEENCRSFSVNLAAAALQFPALNKQVACVLAGFANDAQVEQSVALINKKIPSAFWEQLQKQGLLTQSAY